MMDPAMPSTVVMIKPRCWTPGRTARAHKPTMKPTMIDQMMCNMGLMLNRLPARRRLFFQVGQKLLALAVGFVDRQIFVARGTESVDHPRLLNGFDTVRHITRQVVGIARLHVVRRSVDDQLHVAGEDVDDLLLGM